jgi:hypothetical protein
VRFFFDNTMSPYLARAVAVLEEGLDDRNEVVHLKTKFPANTPDVTWISALGAEREWVIVSGDLRITRVAAERAAWRESGLTAFFLKKAWAEQKLLPFSSRFIAWWPNITAQAQMAAVGKGFLIPWGGQRFDDVPR